MPVNLASHDPNMNNSSVSFYGQSPQGDDGRNEYLTYDGKKGISTISAIPIAESTEPLPNGNFYLYWNFKENEVMCLYEARAENDYSDGVVSDKKKQVVSEGFSNRHIKRI